MNQASEEQATRRSFSEFLSPGTSLSFTPTKIDVVSPTVATDIGTYTLSFDTPQGRMTDRGNYTTVWHKINGQWRIAVDAPVSTTPMPVAGAAAMEMTDLQMLAGSGLSWNDFTPPGFDRGMKLAVMHGRSRQERGLRRAPAVPRRIQVSGPLAPGRRAPDGGVGNVPARHGEQRRLERPQKLRACDFLYIPARHAHFGGTTAQGPSVIQLHGEGPFQVMLGAPK